MLIQKILKINTGRYLSKDYYMYNGKLMKIKIRQ